MTTDTISMYEKDEPDKGKSIIARKIRNTVLIALGIVVTVVAVFFGVLTADKMITDSENKSQPDMGICIITPHYNSPCGDGNPSTTYPSSESP